MPFYAVVDTNVLISSLLSHENGAATVRVAKMIYGKEIVVIYSMETIEKYIEVLNRPKFHIRDEIIAYMISHIRQFGILLHPEHQNILLPDPKDIPFFEATMEGRKKEDVFLITGNKIHFPAASFIVTPREFLNIIEGIN